MIPEKPSSPAAARKHGGPGEPWLERETLHLIDAYEERWYSLKRGQLKAHQWEEVAMAVAAKLGLSRPSKSGTQCRHKIEKLRRRYRAERHRAVSSSSSSSSSSRWILFDRIDRMERGPLPISFCPPHTGAFSGGGDGDGDDEGHAEFRRRRSCSSRRGEAELVAEMRRFHEGIASLQKRSVEMVKEMERDWTEMENRRAELIIESKRRLVEAIAMAFSSHCP